MKKITMFMMLITMLIMVSCKQSTNPETSNIPEGLNGKALELYTKAEAGDVQAQYELAKCYVDGIGCKKDPVETFKWLKKAADQDDIRAQCMVGFFYYSGEGTEKNDSLANDILTKVYGRAKQLAEKGNTSAMFALGHLYGSGFGGATLDQNQAVDWWKKGTELGDKDCRANLIKYYYAKSDYWRIVPLLDQGVKEGDALSMYNLGDCYFKGDGVERDYAKAVELYEKAAKQGHATAKNNLGMCYKLGKGVVQDYTMAVKLFKEGADQEDLVAKHNLGLCYYNGQGVEQDYAKAVQLFEEAKEKGYTSLGDCYFEGHGVERDYIKAVELYKKGAELGDAVAISNLAYCYLYGYGVPQDHATFSRLIELAASLGEPSAVKVVYGR